MKRKQGYEVDNPTFEPDGDLNVQRGPPPPYDNDKKDTSNVFIKSDLEDIEIEEDDPWKVNFIDKDYIPWQDLDGKGKVLRILSYFVKAILALGCLYIFICSLDFLSSAFKLLGGEAAGKVFQQSDILTNPIAGLMMGVLVTVLVQSSSTSTSIVVSMVGANILDIDTAIPIVMGANIGTSVTNTIVSVGQISDKNEFRRAFAGATVHDMFNWLTVIILLPIELITGYLHELSGAIVRSLHLETNKGAKKDILKVITKPFTELIIMVNKNAIKDLATDNAEEGYRIMKLCCDKTTPVKCCSGAVKKMQENITWWSKPGVYTPDQMDTVCPKLRTCVDRDDSAIATPGNCTQAWSIDDKNSTVKALNCKMLGLSSQDEMSCQEFINTDNWVEEALSTPNNNMESLMNSTCNSLTSVLNGSDWSSSCYNETSWQNQTVSHPVSSFSCNNWAHHVEEKDCNSPCDYLFKPLHENLSDKEVGAILLVLSLVLLCICLVGIVKLLHSLLKGPIAILIKKFINADFPGFLKYLTGYVAILIGAGLTIVVQSSSIFTSTLTPLVGIGVIELERMYPLTLGSNIGTTTTAILSALANSGEELANSLQVAFCHLFFNISGILIFYPITYLRFPIPMSKFLGNRTAEYRWFAIVYILLMFFLFPASVFALSVAGWYVLAAVLIPIAILVIIIAIIKVCQAKAPRFLPTKLRDWKFLPEPMRSLRPYDRVMRKIFFCKRFDVNRA